MSNELATKQNNDTYLARYQTAGDGFSSFASEGGPGIIGTMMRCSKGDWSVGQDKDPLPAGTYVVVMDSMSRGWVKWVGNQIVDARVHAVTENLPVPHRYMLNDLDETTWEKNPDGTPRDPWVRDYRVVLIQTSAPHGTFTFIGASNGARVAMQDLCRAYSLDRHRFPDAMPVVSLSVTSRQSKSYGVIKGPKFTVEGWANVDDVKAGKKTTATPAKMVDVATTLNDALPDWSRA
jgi:hypothetical protein